MSKHLTMISKLTVLIVLISMSKAQTNTCHSTCGGNSSNDCSDYALSTSNSSNCKTCAPGYVGGSPSGATCSKGTCNKACSSCRDSTNMCYVCGIGFYDPINNPLVSSPCTACNASCKTCANSSPDGCLQCAVGFFDPLNNPYGASACESCDASCLGCLGSSTNCIGGCSAGYQKDDEYATGTFRCVSFSSYVKLSITFVGMIVAILFS